MRLLKIRGWIFQLALLAFVAVGIDYLNVIFSTSARWAFAALLVVSLIPRGELFSAFNIRFAWIILVYALWCFVTVMWSGVPLLSSLKASAFIFVVIAFVGGGQAWVTRLQPRYPLFFLLPVVACAIFAGLSSKAQSIDFASGIEIYQGLSGNPNYLGILAASALPLPIFACFITWIRGGHGLKLLAWMILAAAILWMLWRSGSRASMLCALSIITIFGLVASSGRRVALAITLTAVAGAALIVGPELEQGVYQRVILKSAYSKDAFLSRRETWGKTLDAAEQGGALGFGYGVSAGFNDFSGGLTSNLYGREKGNAQLAVWEETGLVGLALYTMLLLAMFQDLFRGLVQTVDREQRVEISLLVGLAVGLLLQSIFEAWWTSPGSMESAIFWSTIGVTTALIRRHSAGTESYPAASAQQALIPS